MNRSSKKGISFITAVSVMLTLGVSSFTAGAVDLKQNMKASTVLANKYDMAVGLTSGALFVSDAEKEEVRDGNYYSTYMAVKNGASVVYVNKSGKKIVLDPSLGITRVYEICSSGKMYDIVESYTESRGPVTGIADGSGKCTAVLPDGSLLGGGLVFDSVLYNYNTISAVSGDTTTYYDLEGKVVVRTNKADYGALEKLNKKNGLYLFRTNESVEAAEKVRDYSSDPFFDDSDIPVEDLDDDSAISEYDYYVYNSFTGRAMKFTAEEIDFVADEDNIPYIEVTSDDVSEYYSVDFVKADPYVDDDDSEGSDGAESGNYKLFAYVDYGYGSDVPEAYRGKRICTIKDKAGNVVRRYELASSYGSQVAEVGDFITIASVEGFYRYNRTEGKLVISEKSKICDQIGYIDSDGVSSVVRIGEKVAIENTYIVESSSTYLFNGVGFSDGYSSITPTSVNGYAGSIKKYEPGLSFLIRDKRWKIGLMDKRGNTVLKPTYDYMSYYDDQIVMFAASKKDVIYNTANGNTIISTVGAYHSKGYYTSIRSLGNSFYLLITKHSKKDSFGAVLISTTE